VRGSREDRCARSKRLIAGRAKNLLRGTCFCDEFFVGEPLGIDVLLIC